jgi:hypothetical protein
MQVNCGETRCSNYPECGCHVPPAFTGETDEEAHLYDQRYGYTFNTLEEAFGDDLDEFEHPWQYGVFGHSGRRYDTFNTLEEAELECDRLEASRPS